MITPVQAGKLFERSECWQEVVVAVQYVASSKERVDSELDLSSHPDRFSFF